MMQEVLSLGLLQLGDTAAAAAVAATLRRGCSVAPSPLTSHPPHPPANGAQRLEALDEMVHRADVSSSVMQDKVRALFAWAPVCTIQPTCLPADHL